jgi:hypothetical protein
MSRPRAALLALLVLAAISLPPRVAAAVVPLCLDVAAPAADEESFRKLVRSEVDRHPSHHVVESGCRARLRIELFEAAGTRFLTAQIDSEVPVRFTVKDPAELEPRVTDAVRLVLRNDPTFLADDVAHLNALDRLGRAVLVRGRFTLRMEIFENLSRGGSNAVTAPGGALSLTRGSGNWQIFGRLYGGGAFASPAGLDRALEAFGGVEVGLTYELFDNRSWSPYVSAGAGVQVLRYVGRELATDTSLTHLDKAGVALSARVGVRFFRWYSFDLDVFAQGYAPLFLTSDVDGTLFGDSGIYTPSLQIGLGVGF